MGRAFVTLVLAGILLTGYSGNVAAIGYHQQGQYQQRQYQQGQNQQSSQASYDYGDALGYEVATHSDPSWQRLGTAWDKEQDQREEDSSDDGVSWSVDNGITWGHADVFAGQAVKFRFDMYKELWGRHNSDFLKVWIDWDLDMSFDDAGEMVYMDEWTFKADNEPGYEYGDGQANISKSFYLDLTIPEYVEAVTTWLRARVVCNADGGTLADFRSTGNYGQGEVEDWQLRINPVQNPVPEPSTLLLLGCGLTWLVLYRRKA